MSIRIGDVLITDADSPVKIPIGGELDAADIKMSDGRRILKITGYTPEDFTLTGTMRQRDGIGDPIKKFARLEALARAHMPVTYTWSGDGHSHSFPVIIRATKPSNIVEHNNVEYTLVLFRQSASGLVASGYTATSTRNQRLSQHMTGLNAVRGSTGAGTQAAIDAANAAAAARRRRGH